MQFEQLNKEYQDAAAGMFRGKTVTVCLAVWLARCSRVLCEDVLVVNVCCVVTFSACEACLPLG